MKKQWTQYALSGSIFGGDCLKQQLSGLQFSYVAIVLDGSCPTWQFP